MVKTALSAQRVIPRERQFELLEQSSCLLFFVFHQKPSDTLPNELVEQFVLLKPKRQVWHLLCIARELSRQGRKGIYSLVLAVSSREQLYPRTAFVVDEHFYRGQQQIDY